MFKKITSFILPLIIASIFIINMIQAGEPCCIINGKIVKFTTYSKTSNSSLYLSETEEQMIHKLWLSLTTQKNKTINQPSIGIVTLTTPDRTMFTSKQFVNIVHYGDTNTMNLTIRLILNANPLGQN